MTDVNALGEYLRARRELMNPADVGLSVTGVRRTPGLRREEVATLAGISADYYLRLEQGRDRNPSAQVLQSLARVFALDAAATDYLLSFGTARPVQSAAAVPEVPLGIRHLVESMPLPAFVESRTLDILATNAHATRLFPSIVLGANRLRSVFLDTDEREMFPNFDEVAASFVAAFRTSIGPATEDPEAARLVGELSLGSELFRTLWARHDVKVLAGGVVPLNHPIAGPLELLREKLPLADTGGQILAIYHAAPGSVSEQALKALLSDEQPLTRPRISARS